MRYVELLSVAETTKRTGLLAYQITAKTGKVMKKAKEIISKA
ncbi:Phage protein [Lactococcus cremoris]|nr:Phage protein [Lactococcus cremoris]